MPSEPRIPLLFLQSMDAPESREPGIEARNLRAAAKKRQRAEELVRKIEGAKTTEEK